MQDRSNPYGRKDPRWYMRGGDGSYMGTAETIARNGAVAAPGAVQVGPMAGPVPVGQLIDPERLEQFRASDHLADDPEIIRRTPYAIYNPGMYGDKILFPLTFLAAGSQLALQRPRGVRIHLMVQNDLAIGQIRLNWGAPAGATLGIGLNPGGVLTEDQSTSQNELHIWAAGAGLVQVAYINTDIVNATAR